MTKAERDAIHCLWDNVADFPVARTDEAAVCFMEGVSKLVGAGNAFWLGALRMNSTTPADPLRGWRPRANRYLYPSSIHAEAYRAQVAKMHRGEANHANNLAVRDAGVFRSFRMRQELPSAWFREEFYQTYRASRGFHDECYVIFPLHEDCESYFCFLRVESRKNFTAKEEAIAAYAVRGIKWFHRQLVLSHGVLLAEGPLSPAQREIVRLLLTGMGEKEIALEVNKPVNTTHKYITEIFRKFGVNSRASLMSMWLGQKT